MPGMDGVSVVREARSRGCRTTFLLSTARGELGDKEAWPLPRGLTDYLFVKPYSTEDSCWPGLPSCGAAVPNRRTLNCYAWPILRSI